jgi:hypothetical protein
VTQAQLPSRIDLHAPSPATERVERLLATLPLDARDELAARAQRLATGLGLSFVRPEGERDIPLVLSPVALPAAQLAGLGEAARRIVSALLKVARDVIERRPERARQLFAHLSPLEREALATRWREAEELLISRVDWFVDQKGALQALEVNATIPAMPVYSDAAVRGWLQALAPEHAEQLARRNGSNAEWVVEGIFRAGKGAGRSNPLDVQLLHREGDPQISELRALAALLRARGAAARTVTPADVALDGDPRRVVYRHLFARYVERSSALGAALLDPVRYGIWNRVDGWLEVKGLFAELSWAAKERRELFTAEEHAALDGHVPWTRVLDDVSDAELLPRWDALVLKRSNDYGGKSVVVGRDAGRDPFRAALAAARRDPPASWVAQGFVDSPARERWLAWRDSIHEPVRAKRVALHLDISTYASTLPGAPLGGSVCRAAPKNVVNIVTGGGVAPLFAEEVLADAV